MLRKKLAPQLNIFRLKNTTINWVIAIENTGTKFGSQFFRSSETVRANVGCDFSNEYFRVLCRRPTVRQSIFSPQANEYLFSSWENYGFIRMPTNLPCVITLQRTEPEFMAYSARDIPLEFHNRNVSDFVTTVTLRLVWQWWISAGDRPTQPAWETSRLLNHTIGLSKGRSGHCERFVGH